MAPQHAAIKYRIPVVDGRTVYLCIRCGQIIDVNLPETDIDVYESSDGTCDTCQGIVGQEEPDE